VTRPIRSLPLLSLVAVVPQFAASDPGFILTSPGLIVSISPNGQAVAERTRPRGFAREVRITVGRS